MLKMNAHSWMFGLLGFLGLLGFTTGQPWTLLNFAFFAGFQYYWWYKMLGPVESVMVAGDERFKQDRTKAASTTFTWGFVGIFLASAGAALMFADPAVLYRAELLVVAFGFALTVNAWAFYTYRLDQQGA
ncbi:DUF3796 domain-containing protein [Eggerthella lenta]|nr:DUF3796 domain-containing protein [Eggerthella lenta]MDB1806916.1 DUF3796 domain-containing protein [Eggerthella lenta]